ncbi:nickel-dependent lactate racemase [Lacrimispora algidixylanolytica]|uniref:Lactate racemization operon protein LarA n=1 Tax=Lacrimispora algidixylanolytica TaxID=94868 RepID=A0A419SYC1_9FIRM|nr:nickel-dependent lactate racemase [Lacrimispora algidixylanolytica]RKD30159.1 lactate racemization operon protein LarA [Lacrimispora algidixylanolytica]
MAVIKLPFGRGNISESIPDNRLNGILLSGAHSYKADGEEEAIVRRAMEQPIHSKRLKELVKGKKNIVLIASDHTRPVPSKVIAPAMIEEIKEGNPEAQLTILIATGFHRPTTRGELIDKFGQEIVDRTDIHFVIHESQKDEDMVFLDTLPSGGKFLIHRIAAEADLLISEGFIEPHFFAGFSGGRKSVLPGVSSGETVMANHCSEFIDSEYARTGILEGNPIHRDMIYAAKKAKLAFIVNVVLDENKKVIKAYAGHFDEAHKEGCRFVDTLSGVDAIPSDIVISTNGGYPLDQNIYQSVKGMTAAEATCNPGGVIIMVSSCMDGHGGESLYDTFAGGEDKNAIMRRFLDTPRDKTVPDQWESQILCRILLKHKVIMVTKAPKEMVCDMQMDYADTVEEAISMADDYLNKTDGKITVIPDGVSVIVRNNRQS